MLSTYSETENNSKRPIERFGFILFFYLCIPTMRGLLSGLNASGSQHLGSSSAYIIYWVCSTVSAWIAFGIGTHIASWIGRFFKAPLYLVLFIGCMIGANVLWMPFLDIRNEVLASLAAPGEVLRHPWSHPSILVMVYHTVATSIMWISLNLICSVWFGIPRFGHTNVEPDLRKSQTVQNTPKEPDAALDETPLEELNRRLLPHTTDRIVSMKAEDHYTLIQIGENHKLIYMPFSKAVIAAKDLGGIKTHRSHWVSVKNVRGVIRENGNLYILLSSSQKIPVSRNRKNAVERALSMQNLNNSPS